MCNGEGWVGSAKWLGGVGVGYRHVRCMRKFWKVCSECVVAWGLKTMGRHTGVLVNSD